MTGKIEPYHVRVTKMVVNILNLTQFGKLTKYLVLLPNANQTAFQAKREVLAKISL